ncbi:MAG: hypothetical protein OSJ58_06290 [Dysosmobacter sp.]|nr:hypothetical protein [Dysosmobacter sp.]
MRKTTRKKIAPIVITAAVILYMIPLFVAVLSMAGFLGGQRDFGAIPFLLGYAILGGAVIAGIIKALFQRLNEIDGGEEEEASQY